MPRSKFLVRPVIQTHHGHNGRSATNHRVRNHVLPGDAVKAGLPTLVRIATGWDNVGQLSLVKIVIRGVCCRSRRWNTPLRGEQSRNAS
jgi:hypothetical protein